jgi:cbb3-type cytochrome oxidase maturation protein
VSILLVLIPVTLIFVVAGGIAFFWAVDHDQFDDMETPALQPLADSEPDAASPDPAYARTDQRR